MSVLVYILHSLVRTHTCTHSFKGIRQNDKHGYLSGRAIAFLVVLTVICAFQNNIALPLGHFKIRICVPQRHTVSFIHNTCQVPALGAPAAGGWRPGDSARKGLSAYCRAHAAPAQQDGALANLLLL